MKKDLHISKSKIHGGGVFTNKSFNRGDAVFIMKGKQKKFKIRTESDSRKFDSLAPDVANWIGIDKDTWVNPQDGFSTVLNHSCNPNVGIKGRVTFVALRDILAGEELTFDYSITEDDVYWKFKCHCGAKNCRGTVRSIQYLPRQYYRRYHPFISRYFQIVYHQHNYS